MSNAAATTLLNGSGGGGVGGISAVIAIILIMTMTFFSISTKISHGLLASTLQKRVNNNADARGGSSATLLPQTMMTAGEVPSITPGGGVSPVTRDIGKLLTVEVLRLVAFAFILQTTLSMFEVIIKVVCVLLGVLLYYYIMEPIIFNKITSVSPNIILPGNIEEQIY
jgi:hypothetical protein